MLGLSIRLQIQGQPTVTSLLRRSRHLLLRSGAVCGGAVGTPITPNSSVSWSSTDAAGENGPGWCKKHQLKMEEEALQKPSKGDQDGGDGSKKLSNLRKKGEKRAHEPCFAFMTVSEVDHLEDGYRWRKYGQKAVKDSPYPRSYYRCTTQKCLVKKRVERSFQDPKTVITTYEGQHTHHCPVTIRGSSHMIAPLPMVPSGFLRYQLMQLHPMARTGR